MSIVEFRLHQNSNIKIKVATQIGERPFYFFTFLRTQNSFWLLSYCHLAKSYRQVTNLLAFDFSYHRLTPLTAWLSNGFSGQKCLGYRRFSSLRTSK